MSGALASPIARPLDWRCSPADAVAAWPRDVPLAALISADHSGSPGAACRYSRWSILAPGDGAAQPGVRSGPARVSEMPADLPFFSGRILCIPYEAGYAYEPRAFAPGAAVAAAPISIRVGAAYLHDAQTDQWWFVGESAAAAEALEARTGSLAHAARAGSLWTSAAFHAGALRSETGREAYTASVQRILGHIHAGDVYQVNLAHHLRAPFEGSPRALFLRLLDAAGPGFGALLEHAQGDTRRAIVSISPELFLDADLAHEGSRAVVTRPIKGTGAVGSDLARAERALRASGKDAAELAMIVDLMRNDLGRVCEYGSIRVDSPRDIESLAGGSLLHAVATISGRLRAGCSLDDLLRAAFPPGSVTGAPKIAAMKLIRELEPSLRGAYCGAIGFVSDQGPARLSVAIRTATITGVVDPADAGRPDDRIAGEIDFPVGAGVVADSDPALEWEETLAKADAFARTLRSVGAARPEPAFAESER